MLLPKDWAFLKQFCHEEAIAIETVELEKGDAFPTLDGVDALWVMGGPMNVSEEHAFPWLIDEKALIRQAVGERQLPYMGICLGAQLLANALGGTVAPMVMPEVGVLPITLTPAGKIHPITAGLPETRQVLQWHGQAVQQLPANATLLASSVLCPIQAYAVSDRAFGLQFHTEVTAATVTDLGANSRLSSGLRNNPRRKWL